MIVSAKSSEILFHMFEIIEDRMPAQIKPATMTDADFPSPRVTFIAMDCAGIPDTREANILYARLAFKNNERCLNCCLRQYKIDPLRFQPIIKNGCYSLRRLMSGSWTIRSHDHDCCPHSVTKLLHRCMR